MIFQVKCILYIVLYLLNNIKMSKKNDLEHHKQLELCATRAPYRQGKKLTAVKVYTVNNESQHLLIFGVPKINIRSELKSLCQQFGDVKIINATEDYTVEIFTECFHICYERIQSARIAKRKLDTRSFYGGVLHVCYAPELESTDETRNKLLQRRKDVYFKTKNISKEISCIDSNEVRSVSKFQTDIEHLNLNLQPYSYESYDVKGKTINEVYRDIQNAPSCSLTNRAEPISVTRKRKTFPTINEIIQKMREDDENNRESLMIGPKLPSTQELSTAKRNKT